MIIVPLLLLGLSWSEALMTKEPPVPTARSTRQPEQRWFNARLDHFSAANTDSYPMRYYYNDELYRSSAVVIYVGGEWSISPGWLQAGLAYELAEEVGAALIYTEHRYYGLSRPTPDTNTTSLRYLTVDQALGDLVQFISYVKSNDFENGRYVNARVALVGCSYAGSMATWMRLAYPHLVDVAFSDSGPLYAEEDFPEYLEAISEALSAQGGAGCVEEVRGGIARVEELLQTTAGAQQVSQMFNTCAELSNTSPLDLATFFFFGVTETFAYLVQYATPGDIPEACNALNDTAIADPAQRLANWVTSQAYAQPCIEPRYSEIVARHTNLSYDAPDSVMRLWTYQTCVEFGWYQTTSGADQPFGDVVPLGYFHQLCRDLFGNSFDESLLRSGIARTNLLFGGVAFRADHVAAAAGGADPWAPMGPRAEHGTHLSPVYYVPDVSHCRAIRPTATAESEELRSVQYDVIRLMARRLSSEPWSSSGVATVPSSLLILVAIYLLL